ncbi:hypothetical protein SAMN05444920_1452 [Nonomuraea solani]|uniref:Uncharacterized protein n=1 Tax=Nonomuraea solani TaxID=1144553 RepID=A0A1H6F191_9ACTN|nr:hypothetical protein [Nonomuraea solani]SEH03822.1 hypothetical protein SAMN05444920_1452 [Nonomuraea solani]
MRTRSPRRIVVAGLACAVALTGTAHAAERLAAFYAAMVRLLEDHSHLVLGSEVGRSRFETGAYGFWRAHVRALLVAARTPGADALVDVLLAPLAPEVYGHQRTVLGLTPEQITEALARLAKIVETA